MELFPGHWAQPRSELVDHDMVGPPAHGFIEILNELPSCHGRGRSKLKDLPCYKFTSGYEHCRLRERGLQFVV